VRDPAQPFSSSGVTYFTPTFETLPVNPGSIVQLIYNTDNDYSYDENLPFNPSQISAATDTLDNYNRVYYASNGLGAL